MLTVDVVERTALRGTGPGKRGVSDACAECAMELYPRGLVECVWREAGDHPKPGRELSSSSHALDTRCEVSCREDGLWGDSKSVLIRDREGSTGPLAIHQVFLDTLERRQLTQAPVGSGDWRFEVSPDGKRLAFIRYERPGIADLYVVPMRGGEPRRLSDWNRALTGLSWTPNGREIVYSIEEPVASRLWRIPADGATLSRGSPIADISAEAANPSISRPMPGQPARLAFQTITRNIDIHVMDLEASAGNDTIESKPFSNSTRIEGPARFSPDGSRIAFASFRSGGPEIWVASRDGSGLRQVTSLGAPELVVGAWSPDGRWIVFDAAIAGNSDIYVVGTDGGQLRRLTSEPSIDATPSWSRDGNKVYFSSTRAGMIADIRRVSSDGGEAVRITRNGGFEPKESSDGRYLFYLDRPPNSLAFDGTASLMRAPLAGGQEDLILERIRPFYGRSPTRESSSSSASRTSMRSTCTDSAIGELHG
jgi:Tol biopolymer transport system component